MNAATRDLQPASLQVARASPDDVAAWDGFVLDHPQGSFFHLFGWQTVLERAFGHDAHYLLARADGRIQGVLPLARVRSRLFGDALISTPFCVYGGALAASDEARVALEDAACTLASDLGVDHLELRNRERTRPDWPCRDLYVTFRKRISHDPQANLNAVPRKQRAVIRKGIASDLRCVVDQDVERHYRLYAASLRNLGTPVFTHRYLEILREVFGDRVEVQTIAHGNEDLASVFSFYFRDEVLPYYGGGTESAREHFANDFMYWQLMCRAAERGVGIFDFGRSKRDSGAYKFKVHWGFEPQPLHYEYFLVRATQMPNLSPNNPRYRLMIATWKRLPLGVTKMLGPPLARYLG